MSKLVEVIYAGRLSRGDVTFRGDGDLRHFPFRRGVPFRVPAEVAEVLRQKPSYVVGAQPFMHFYEENESGNLLIRRFGALGDLIMLRAVVVALKKKVGKFMYGLTCQGRHAGIFEYDRTFLEVVPDVSAPRLKYLGELYLDGVVEVDHSGNPVSHVHRAKLFWEHLVKDLDVELPVDLDWDIPIGPQHVAFADEWLFVRGVGRDERVRPLVGVQVRGSGNMKSLPPEEVSKLVSRLTDEDYDVVIIDRESQPRLAYRDRVFEAPGRKVLDVVALMKQLDAVICMDSGVLWLAHVAKIPTICIMGPTRPEERISLHPLYRDGLVTAVRLNDLVKLKPLQTVGCPSCFENAKACNFRYACINEVPVERFYGKISEDLDRFTRGRRKTYANHQRHLSEMQV